MDLKKERNIETLRFGSDGTLIDHRSTKTGRPSTGTVRPGPLVHARACQTQTLLLRQPAPAGMMV